MKLRTLTLVVFLTLVASADAQLPNITDPRVQIKLPDPKGDSVSLVSMKGKVIILDFWASWCVPCAYANRELVQLYKDYKSKGLEIFSVSIDESKKAWQKAITRQRLTWTHVNDPGGWDAQTGLRWNVQALPTTYLINKNGDVVSVNLEGKELKENVKKLLQE